MNFIDYIFNKFGDKIRCGYFDNDYASFLVKNGRCYFAYKAKLNGNQINVETNKMTITDYNLPFSIRKPEIFENYSEIWIL